MARSSPTPHAPRVEHDLGGSSRGAVDAARRVGYPWTEQMSRKLSRKVRETGCSSSQKRSEPVAHPCRGPGGQPGDEHGGPPWFKGTRGRRRSLRGTYVSLYRIHFHRYWTGVRFRLVEVLQFRTTVLWSALNGRPVQISKGFAVSHRGSAVGTERTSGRD